MKIPRSSSIYWPLLLLLLNSNVGRTLRAQTVTTQNQFIVGAVDIPSAGLVTVLLPPGIISQSKQLSFDQHSYFSCVIGNTLYTNNDRVPVPSYGHLLTDGITIKIADTIRTTWPMRDGVDIIQDIYPVAFTKSGQIVYKWKFFNHNATDVTVSCQYLLDIQLSDQTVNPTPGHVNSDDGPWILTRWDYNNNWRSYPNINPVPWFYCAFLNHLPNAPSYDPGLSAQGYTDYSPLGLIPPTKMTIGDWTKMIFYPFGSGGMPGGPVTSDDDAILLEFPQRDLPGGQLTEAARTSYGTGEFETCVGNMFGLVFYPHHLTWTPKGSSGFYSPNPFDVQFYLFNPDQNNSAINTKLTLTVGNNLTLYDSINHALIGKSQTQPTTGAGELLGAGEVGIPSFEWFVKADPADLCTGDVLRQLKFTGSSSLGPPTFVDVLAKDDTCGHPVSLDCTELDKDPPIYGLHPDTNEFVKNIDVHDDRKTDRGLKSITWHPSAKKDSLHRSNFVITYSPAIRPCVNDKDTHVVHIVQLDSSIGGCFDFTYEDCVGHQAYQTICMLAHPLIIIPDTLRPYYTPIVRNGSSDSSICNARFDSVLVSDDRPHDKGIDTIFVLPGTQTNMTVSIAPYTKHASVAEFSVAVNDSSYDGGICIRTIDGAKNFHDTCLSYCTIHDILPPIVTVTKDKILRGRWNVTVSDNRPWDRLIDSVFILNSQNIAFPSLGMPPPRSITSGQPYFSFPVTAIDTFQVSSFCVKASDLVGNMSDSICVFQGIDTDGVCPNIVISPDPRTSPTSVTGSVNDIHFNDPPTDLDTNIWDSGVDIVWFTNNTGIVTPDTIHGYCAKTIPAFRLWVLDTLKVDTQSCVTIHARDCHGNECSYTWCYPYIRDSLPPKLVAHYVGHDSIAVTVSDARLYDRGLQHINTLNEVNLSPYDTIATSAGLYIKNFGLSRPLTGESTTGGLHAEDFWGALIPNPFHTASVNFGMFVQDFRMRSGYVTRGGTSFYIPVYFSKNDSFAVASKGITDFTFSFALTGDSFAVRFDSVSVVNTASKNWTVSAMKNATDITITGSMLPNGKPLDADLLIDPPDSLVLLYFSAPITSTNRNIVLAIDSIQFNHGKDTTYTGISASAVMPAPWGSLSGSHIVIIGSCSPIVESDSEHRVTATSFDPPHPNPTSRVTELDYSVSYNGEVRLYIYDELGREVARIIDEVQKQGSYVAKFDSSVLPNGNYIIRLQAGGEVISRRIGVLR